KSFTSKEVNKVLKRDGTLWQREYFDRYIRNAEHYGNTVRYIRENPVQANLCDRAEEWRFSSAWVGRKV
ncbi:MAG TPA: transposase, partial [Planctomycetota bacterium]|nr:transposase [Planctomycetota bacterium]